MNHDVQVSILKELMSQLDEGRNVDAGVMLRNPTEVYVDRELAERERQAFFRDHPQLIGFSGALPGPGSYMTVDDFGVPVLATRDKDGEFRAFVNACRHRGARVAEGHGEQNRFVCPFHNWAYGSDGALKTIPKHEHVGAIDKACNGLVELPAEERGGLLWVHPRRDGVIDLDTQLAGLEEEIASWDFGRLRFHGESVIEGDLNWKLANDTFGETYHFERLHRNTLGQINYGDALAYEEFGRNHRFVIASRRIDALRELPESEWSLTSGTTPLYYLFPNIQLTWFDGSASMVKIYPHPTDPGKSITKVMHYFSQEMIDLASDPNVHAVSADNTYDRDAIAQDQQVALTLESVMEVFDSTVEQEDYLMGKHQQAASESGELEHLIFGRNEPALHHYHNHFRDALGMPPLEKIEPAA